MCAVGLYTEKKLQTLLMCLRREGIHVIHTGHWCVCVCVCVCVCDQIVGYRVGSTCVLC